MSCDNCKKLENKLFDLEVERDKLLVELELAEEHSLERLKANVLLVKQIRQLRKGGE